MLDYLLGAGNSNRFRVCRVHESGPLGLGDDRDNDQAMSSPKGLPWTRQGLHFEYRQRTFSTTLASFTLTCLYRKVSCAFPPCSLI